MKLSIYGVELMSNAYLSIFAFQVIGAVMYIINMTSMVMI